MAEHGQRVWVDLKYLLWYYTLEGRQAEEIFETTQKLSLVKRALDLLEDDDVLFVQLERVDHE